MKLYTSFEAARNSIEPVFLPKFCYLKDNEAMCGNWCPHFHIIKTGSVKITCSPQEVFIKVEEQ